MNIKDAAKILNLNGDITPKEVKKAYRLAAKEFHPDRNPAGAEMMKMINAAYETLKDFTGKIHNQDKKKSADDSKQENYTDAVNEALNKILDLDGLIIEVCGAWVWVSGETKKHRERLKEADFKYASKKKRWFFRPEDWKSKNRTLYSMDEIREKYGSSQPSKKGNYKIKKATA